MADARSIMPLYPHKFISAWTFLFHNSLIISIGKLSHLSIIVIRGATKPAADAAAATSEVTLHPRFEVFHSFSCIDLTDFATEAEEFERTGMILFADGGKAVCSAGDVWRPSWSMLRVITSKSRSEGYFRASQMIR